MAEAQDIPAMPVIVNQSLARHPLYNCLAQHKLKIRVSETSTESSVIFPMSSVAFFCFTLTPDMLSQMDHPQQRSALLNSVGKFVEVHGHCYVVLVSRDVSGDKTFSLVTELQTQHLASRLQVIPVQSAADAAVAMVDIARLLCRPLAGTMNERFCLLLNRLLLEDVCPWLLAQLGLDTHQQQLVQDGIGSMSRLAAASTADLMDCALDGHTAEAVTRFFARQPETARRHTPTPTSGQ